MANLDAKYRDVDYLSQTQNNNWVVRAKGLVKKYNGKPVIHGIDLAIPKGICFGLLGPNGAGKTTTLRIVLGLSPVDSGTVSVFDLSMPKNGKINRKKIGVVPQRDNLVQRLNVRENLEVYACYFGMNSKEIHHKVGSLLRFIELEDKAESDIRALSGGMRRRLSIARALINDPQLLILDEPSTGLDPQSRHLIWARLFELKRMGKTLLLTTHFMEEAERLCDELIILDDGKIVCQGNPRTLIDNLIEPYVIEIPEKVDKGLIQNHSVRVEVMGDITYCYMSETEAFITDLENHHDLIYMHRLANLEDVFFKLTGRSLRSE